MQRKIFTAVVLVFLALAVGCAPQAAAPAAGANAPVTLKVLYPGDPNDRFDALLAGELGAKLKADLNVTLKMVWVPWSDYWQKKDLMIAAGEDFDLYWDGFPNIPSIVAKKQALALDDLLDKYGPDIKKHIGETNLGAARINGKIVGVPSARNPSSANLTMVNVRQDLLESVGMTEVKTPADLEAFALKVKAKMPEMNGGADNKDFSIVRGFADKNYDYFYTLFAVDQDTNTVYDLFETPAFAEMVKTTRDWYTKHIYNDEITVKVEESDARMQSGRYLWGTASISKASEMIAGLRPNAPGAKLKTYLLNPDKPRYLQQPGGEVICVNAFSRNPDRAIQFLNWIWASQENYDLALYGVLDKDYKLNNGRIEKITTNEFFYEWMFRNVDYQRFTADQDDAFIAQYKAWDQGAKVSNLFGFMFDPEPVKAELAKCLALTQSDVPAVAGGLKDPVKAHPALVAKLKEAGIDKVVAEVQKQLDAFLASKAK